MRQKSTLHASYAAVIAPIILLLGACSDADEPSPIDDGGFVTSVETALAAGSTQAVVSRVTLRRDAVLGWTFLYGSDLQHSDLVDPDLDLTLQSLSIGHELVGFRVVGDELQLVADQSARFESDVNHPERLIQAFPIVAQSGSSITIEVSRASPVLAAVADGKEAGKERTSWVRSVEYVKPSKLLMFESSIESANGTVYEFMESLFPRDRLVPNNYTPLRADPYREPLAARYRFLSSGDTYVDDPNEGRIQTQIATRFRIKNGRPIEWHVTSNVPDEYLPEVKNGIEAWNRYGQAMWGRDLVAFKGKLPDGVKLGDPRYNIVNWDNVAYAGAAYESQASDPLTGIQSHSLVYMPLAWVNIGADYWTAAGGSEAKTTGAAALVNALAKRTFLGRKLGVACAREAADALSIQAKTDPQTFGRELLKGVLFHEVGHALGLAHNFKGSLVSDPADPKKFSSSIMDYNLYAQERAAFDTVDSSAGPLLEYDRQAISALYDDAKSIVSTDPVLPACADAEADTLEGGVDPLCIRYDAGSDPTAHAHEMIALMTDANKKVGATISLPAALRGQAASLPAAASIANVADAQAALEAHAGALRLVIGFYVANFRNLAAGAQKTLYVHLPDTLSASIDPALLRDRELQAVTYAASFESLPPASDAALTDAVAAAETWLTTTAAFASIPANQRAAETTRLMTPIRAVSDAIQGPGATTLSSARRVVVGALNRVPTAPFAIATTPAQVDYEAKALALLETGMTTQVKAQPRPERERTAYVAALLTFKDTQQGQDAIARVVTALKNELPTATTAEAREAVRRLILALGATP